MARQHHDPRQVAQEGRQQVDGVVVEVVGRLVEQQARRPRGHDGGQREPGALATGQGADPALGVQGTETEPLGRLGGAAVGVPRVVSDREVERAGVRRLSCLVGLVGELQRQPLDVSDHPPQRCQRPRQHRADGGVVAERRLLAEHHQVARRIDRPRDDRSGREGAGQWHAGGSTCRNRSRRPGRSGGPGRRSGRGRAEPVGCRTGRRARRPRRWGGGRWRQACGNPSTAEG